MNSFLKILILFSLSAVLLLPSNDAHAKDPDTAIIYSVSLFVRTCDRRSAGTDGDVYVRLNTFAPRFYLDNPGNDRERNQFDEYNLTIPTLTELDDITRIQFNLSGNDGWCVDDIILFVNGSIVFMKSGIGRWLDNDNSAYANWFRIENTELRQSAYWPDRASGEVVCQVPKELPRSIMKRVIDGYIGNLLETEDFGDEIKYVRWNGSSSLSRRNSTSWTYRLGLFAEADVEVKIPVFPNLKLSPEMDIDLVYVVSISCSGALTLSSDLSSIDVSTNNILVNLFKGKLEDKVADALQNVSLGLSAPGSPNTCTLDGNGNLDLTWPTLPSDPLCH